MASRTLFEVLLSAVSMVALVSCQARDMPAVSNQHLEWRDDSTLIVPHMKFPARPNTRSSWMSTAAKNDKLLYVSDAAADVVNVYSYPALRLVGQLTGFHEPQGECTDPSGNVYIANTLDSNVLEYPHGGNVPIAEFQDTGQYPVGCSYDKILNALAVANIASSDGGSGSISLLTGYIRGTFVAPTIWRMRYLGYDRTPNLFVDGTNTQGKFRYSKMSGIGHFYSIKLTVSIANPGGIQYAEKHREMVIGNGHHMLYQTIGPEVLNAIALKGACRIAQFTVSHSKLIAPDPCRSAVLIYPYPAGGAPIKSITTGLSKPFGTALSLAPATAPPS